MSRRNHLRTALPVSLVIAVLVCLSLLAPLPVAAGQRDEASPIPVETEVALPTDEAGPTLEATDQASEFSAAAVAASFDAASYAAEIGGSVNVVLTINYTSFEFEGTLLIFNPAPGEATLGSLDIQTTGGAVCTASVGGDGNISGLAGAADAGTCTISFTINVDSDAIAGEKNFVAALVPGVSPGPSVGFTVVEPGLSEIAAAFDAPLYEAAIGGFVPATLTITMTSTVPGGAYTIFNPAPTEAFLIVQPPVTTGGASCTATVDGAGNIIGSVSSSVSGVCTISFSIGVNSDAVAGEKNFLAALIPGLAPGPSASFAVTDVTSIAASFDAASYSALPGGSVPATLTLTIPPATLPSDFVIFNPAPGEATLASATASGIGDGVCSITGPDASGNLNGAFSALLQDGTCTISFTVDVYPGAIAGEKNFLTALIPGLAPGPSATFTVTEIPTAPLTASFDAASYSTVPGGSIAATLTITTPANTLPSNFIVYNPAPGEGTLANATALGSGGALCSVSGPDGDGHLSGTFSSLLLDGTCTISFTVDIDADAIIGEKNFLAALIPGLAPGPSVPFSVTAVPEPLTVADGITLNVAPGEVITGNLSAYVSGGVPPYVFAQETDPTQGTLDLNPDGTFTYTANLDAEGSDTFTFTVTDSEPVLTATAAASGTVTIVFAAAPTPSPTPTEPVLTPSPTLEPGVTPTATSDDGVVGPGDPRATVTPDAGDPGEDDGGPVTRLPSTGSGAGHISSSVIGLLMTGMLLLAGAIIVGRRRFV